MERLFKGVRGFGFVSFSKDVRPCLGAKNIQFKAVLSKLRRCRSFSG